MLPLRRQPPITYNVGVVFKFINIRGVKHLRRYLRYINWQSTNKSRYYWRPQPPKVLPFSASNDKAPPKFITIRDANRQRCYPSLHQSKLRQCVTLWGVNPLRHALRGISKRHYAKALVKGVNSLMLLPTTLGQYITFWYFNHLKYYPRRRQLLKAFVPKIALMCYPEASTI